MTHLTLWLAQTQLFSGLGFLLLFLALELGLSWVLVVFRVKAHGRGQTQFTWVEAYRFWVRIFALVLAISFALTLAVLLQLGALWSGLWTKIGDVASPYVVVIVTSFFLTRTIFLGAMLFGTRRGRSRLHVLAVVGVALGSTITVVFMVGLLAWMHTPTGMVWFNGRALVTSIADVMQAPATLSYVLLYFATALTITGFVMLAVVAIQVMRNPIARARIVVLQVALVTAALGVALHLPGVFGLVEMASDHQPARAAATAGYWQSGTPPNLAISGWPNERLQRNEGEISWRGRAKHLLAQDNAGHWIGLDQFSGMTPPLALTFWSFRLLLLLLGMLCIPLLVLVVKARRSSFDMARWSAGWCRFSRVWQWPALASFVMAFAYIQGGALPFAVQQIVTLSEVMSPVSVPVLGLTTVFYLLTYLAIMIGFALLLRHYARFGVVPIRRRRRAL